MNAKDLIDQAYSQGFRFGLHNWKPDDIEPTARRFFTQGGIKLRRRLWRTVFKGYETAVREVGLPWQILRLEMHLAQEVDLRDKRRGRKQRSRR